MRAVAASAAAAVLLLAGALAHADEETRELERIARERAAVEAVFAAAQEDCRTRFAVTACVDRARAERRAALQKLRAEESVIDAAQRQRRAAQREEAIRRKLAEREARPAAPVAASQPPSIRIQERRASAPAAVASRPRVGAGAERSADEARAREAYEARQRQIEAHRAESQRRQAERAAKGKPAAAPLPAPQASGASAPR